MAHGDARPPSERRVLWRRRASFGGLDVVFATEDVRAPTDWRIDEQDHVVVLHQAGRLGTMETVFESGPSSDVLPRIGDVWVIPAGRRYDALAQGRSVSFCEFRFRAETGGRALAPQIGRRDPFLQLAAERLSRTIGRGDDLAAMLRDSLAETIRLHLQDAYGETAPAPSSRDSPRLSDTQKRALSESLADALGERHSLASMAATVGLDMRDFLPAFRAAFGTSPRQHLIRLRLDCARRMLEETSSPITAIALAVGFSTPSHFATTFRQHFGLRPTDVRRRA